MLKSLVLATVLLTSNAALACGGKPCSDCTGEHDHTTEVVDVSKAPGTHVALAVSGMTCGACSKKVTAALTALEGVNAVLVDHETGKAEVAFDEAKTTTDAMIAAIQKLSFEARVAPESKPPETQTPEKQG
jgi:copper chaperone CopZ